MPDTPIVKKLIFRPKGYNSRETESNRLELPNGLVLRFSRYGIRPLNDGETYQNFDLPAGVPADIGSYEYCRRHITHGYIYMYSAKLKLIDEYGVMGGIILRLGNQWNGETPDIRLFHSEEHTNYIYLNKGNVYEFAYSPVQWPPEYILKLTSDSSLRRKRFQKLDTNDYEGNPDVVDYSRNLVWTHPEASEPENVARLKHEFGMNEIKALEYKTPYLFLALHDPIGCATDLRADQQKHEEELSALLGSMVTPASAGTSAEDLSHLYQHALTFYRMFYSEESKKDKRFDSFREKIVKEEFLKKMLLTEERKELRIKIDNARQALLRFMSGDYYTGALAELPGLHPCHRERAATLVIKHHEGLVTDACLIDRHLDIEDTTAQLTNQKVVAYMKETTQEGSAVDLLLSATFDLEDDILFIKEEKAFDLEEALSRADLVWANAVSMLIAWESQFGALMDTTEMAPPATSGTANATTAAATAASEAVQAAPAPEKITKATVVSTKRGHFLVVPDRWLNKIEIRKRGVKVKGGTRNQLFWVLDKIELEKLLAEMHCIAGEEIVRRWGNKKNYAGVPLKRIAGLKNLLVGGYNKNPAIAVIIDEANTAVRTLEPPAKAPAAPEPPVKAEPSVKASRFSDARKLKVLQTVLTSKAFAGVTGLMSALNLTVSIKRADFKNSPYYSITTVGAAVAELAQFIFYFRVTAFAVCESNIRLWTFVSGAFGTMSCGLIGIACFMDSITAFKERDTRTGLAYLGSAIAWSAAAGISGTRLFTRTPPKWARNKWLLIAYVLGVGLMFLAAYLTRSPMEKFLANCILQKGAMKKVKEWEFMTAARIAEKLCAEKEEIVSDTFSKWRNFETSMQTFYLMLMNMEVRPNHKHTRVRASDKWYNTTYLDEYTFRHVTVNCWYADQITFNSAIEYGLRVFYTKPGKWGKLYYKDIEGEFTETASGCKVFIQRAEIENRLPYGARICWMYFFQRITDGAGNPYPPLSGGEAVYFMQHVRYDHSHDAMNMDSTAVMDAIAFSGSKDKAALSFSQLYDILKEDSRYRNAMIVCDDKLMEHRWTIEN